MTDYSQHEFLMVEVKDKVALVTLNRPDVLNAINQQGHVELEDFFAEVAADEEVNAIVLTGAGRAFSSGGDIRGMKESLEGRRRRAASRPARLIGNILDTPQPIVAAVNGPAAGLGATIALFCDIVVAAEDARIGDTHVKVGYVAGDGGAIIWPLLVGPNKAKELLMLGDFVTGKDLERLGLVNYAVPKEQVLPKAMELARRLADGPAIAIRGTKHAINKWLKEQANLVLDPGLFLERLSGHSEDHKEAVSAFLEQRTPKYTGR